MTSGERILVIEDEKNIIELLRYNLEKEGYRVQAILKGDEGLEEAKKNRPDLLLLDVMLPGMNGFEICRALRQNEKTADLPIIMLTAKAEEIDQVLGFEIGADDYITKPFSPRQLLARIKAVLRRVKGISQGKMIRVGDLELDPERYVVSLKGKELEFTSKEFDLLKCLLQARGRVLSREHLLETVWGYDRSIQIETRTVDMHVGNLRRKLKTESHRIVTVKNVGYRFDLED